MSNTSCDPAAKPGEKPRPARLRILEAAGPLFYREGFHAVGVDRVIAEAGVAKATFYKHFPSKDDLILACIGRAEDLTGAVMPDDTGARPFSDYARAMLEAAGEARCLGCTFQVTVAEFSDPAHPAHAEARAAKERVLGELERRARLQRLPEPEAAAARVFLLLEGVWAAVRMFGPDAPLAAAGDALDRLTG
ncbi:MAG: TetR/AcrR family transcriptional regulator [Defluviimonas sp.]|uniref:TetR/AcrR family transcriptional regulator n=1 Tax=Albidovulum sp. TaxID=1872424 RepID=UPI001DD5D9DF|nr:TetR/AcrR family transcriptional regulator [Paracoccaceae bacterium]MCC0063676.1 TetR/AcrR family transcriptional regulator [Defluviimonas sp.]